MLSRLLAAYRRLSENRQVEDSPRVRLLVWAAAMLSLIAFWSQGGLGFNAFVLSAAGLAVGTLLSYVRRRRNNWWLKLLLSLAMLLLLVNFLQKVGYAYYDLRYPLADLFLWLLVLHGFDQPGRRDLMLMLISSFMLLALTGSLSLSTGFLALVVVYLAAAVPALMALESSRMREGALVLEGKGAKGPLLWRGMRSVKTVAIYLAVLVLLATFITLFLPQDFNYAGVLPFSPMRLSLRGSLKGLRNPGYGDLPSRLPRYPYPVNPDAYYGIASFLDLRMRGDLSETLLMRVKSTHPAYWRGVAFDLYRGAGWERSSEETVELNAALSVFDISPDPYPISPRSERCVQTYYVEREMPNAVFAAYRPVTVYYPSDRLTMDEYQCLRSPFLLDNGLTYSIISELPRPVPEEFRLLASVAGTTPEGMERYLELPEVSDRLRLLVEEAVSGMETPYEKALALQGCLLRNYRYNLVPPPQDPDEDAVEFFLFDSKEGNCEHFASALAVACRVAGIPSRVVTGFATGDFNPFSGLYEVRARDAHAWVEAYFHGVGWVPLEATPGFSMPSGERDPLRGIVDALKWLGHRLGGLVPAWLRRAAAETAGAVGGFFAGLAYAGYRNPPLAALLLLAAAGIPLYLLLYRRRRRRDRLRLALAAAPPRERVVGEFLSFLREMERRGRGREPAATPVEYLEELAAATGFDGWDELAHLFYRARYGGEELSEYEALGFLSRLRAWRERVGAGRDGGKRLRRTGRTGPR
jgi:transglutaminase-like putative cysteine protease